MRIHNKPTSKIIPCRINGKGLRPVGRFAVWVLEVVADMSLYRGLYRLMDREGCRVFHGVRVQMEKSFFSPVAPQVFVANQKHVAMQLFLACVPEIQPSSRACPELRVVPR